MRALRARLGALLAEVERGAAIPTPLDPALHIGSQFGEARLRPLFGNKTQGRYLETLAEDRGGREERR